jgi:hypothetical protein
LQCVVAIVKFCRMNEPLTTQSYIIANAKDGRCDWCVAPRLMR